MCAHGKLSSNEILHICSVYVHIGFCTEFVDTFKYVFHIFPKTGGSMEVKLQSTSPVALLPLYLMKLLSFSKGCRERRSRKHMNRVDFGERLRKLNIGMHMRMSCNVSKDSLGIDSGEMMCRP